jgi:hypothetical protein
MLWPWVLHLNNAVADPGDPYAHAWELWWNYHQTFTDPFNLFQANIFYPAEYTLAFTEHGYGIAILFFPLLAVGLPPLTVHSLATFLGFAFCGYGAFRLARTLTDCTGAAIVAGILYAFVPYRYLELSHLHYIYSGWIPLLLEALILFSRDRTWKRAIWLGVTFLFNGLTAITWLVLTTVPLAFTLVFLVARYRRLHDVQFWIRGFVAMAAATALQLPFLLPYYYLSQIYEFSWSMEQIARNPTPIINWVTAERRSVVWRGMGVDLGGNTGLFPGLMTLLLPVAGCLRTRTYGDSYTVTDTRDNVRTLVGYGALNAVAIIGALWWLFGTGYAMGPPAPNRVFTALSMDVVLFVTSTAILLRICLSKTILRSPAGEMIALGIIWAAVGFLMSLGTNTFFFRVLFQYVFVFQSQRVPQRAAMLCYLGLGILAAFGARSLGEVIRERWPRVPIAAVFVALAAISLFELRATGLTIYPGVVAPDELTLRIKRLQMKGGLLELPTGRGKQYEHFYMLRAADHGKPLINASGTFLSRTVDRLEELEEREGIKPGLMDFVESIPTSYVTVHNSFIAPERRAEFDSFLSEAWASGRLRYIGRYDGVNDLYAVTRIEPEAQPDSGVVSPF